MRSTSRDTSTRNDRHARRVHAPRSTIRRLHREAERRQDPRDVVLRHVHAEHAADARRAQRRALRSRAGRGIPIDQAADGAAGADLLEQRRARAMPGRRRVDVGAALEARRGFGLEAEPLARAADRRPAGSTRSRARCASSPRRSRSRRRPSRRRPPRRASASAMTSMSGVERPLDAVERRQSLARRARGG